ncbi:PREDICTED: putative zinc finger protein 724 isoform X5 [Papilio polytes]|uniref:putative zinc finger protein 724 isoform X5 n=1 Tax=Papilio polytes TaxID=76194 RepID=UPI0006764FBF|nr:PREDICTED: putative zinc finger protein 724 isoform X5 [Papilio polytes]
MDFDNIVVKESPGLCRCCLSEGCYKDLSTEYTWMDDTEIYADMLLDCFDISISQHNDGPNGPNRLICEVCVTRLRDACNFKKQVLASEKKFVDMIGRGGFKPKVTYNVPIKSETILEVQPLETEVEYLDEGMDFGDDVLKDDVTAQTSTENFTITTLPIKGKKGKAKKTVTKTEKKACSKVVLVEKPKVSKPVTKGAKSSTVEDSYKKTEIARKLCIKRRNVEYVLQYSNVTPFMWYKGKYRCFYCAEPMKDPDLLRDHTAKVHQFANLELVVFDRTKNNRNRDAAVKIDVTDISCKLCFKQFNNLEQLIHHLIIAHDAEYDVSVPNCLLPFKLDKDQPTCPICDMKFVFFEYLLRHSNKHHLSHDYICDVCGTSFQGENHLKMHNRYYHREGGYTCEHCGIILTTLSKKILHEKNVHMVNLSTCPHCPETFKSPYFKKLHLANVHGIEELKIKCPYCPKVYPQESIMSRHMRRVHLREKNVECEVCGDKFFGPYDVKLHMLKHNGDKKFVCAVCGKKFSKKNNLNTHLITHTDKKFICDICNKEFTNQQNLKIHNKRHLVVNQSESEQNIVVFDELNETEMIQMEFVNDEIEGAELTGKYIQ